MTPATRSLVALAASAIRCRRPAFTAAAWLATLLAAFTVLPCRADLINLSVRGLVGDGEERLIGGFVVGAQGARVLMRNRGPSLADLGVPGPLVEDPWFRLHAGTTPIAENDNWQQDPSAADIAALGLAPVDPLESALIQDLDPGPHGIVLHSETPGVGVVGMFELGDGAQGVVNFSGRGVAGDGAQRLTGGFIVADAPSAVLVRARGPSMADLGVAGSLLQDPRITLYRRTDPIAENDDWRNDPQAELIEATGLAPSDDRESALLLTLEPGAYTVVVDADARGIAAVGIFDLALTGSLPGGSSQAILGPVVNAEVAVYHSAHLDAGPRCVSRTQDSNVLDLAGRMEIDGACIAEPGFYLLAVSGGQDIDADDDGVRDAVPTPMQGVLHGLLSREQILAGDARVNAVTEVAYQYARYLLAGGYGQETIEDALDQAADALLLGDLSGDGALDHQDLAAWHPRRDLGLYRPGLARLQALAAALHAGEDPAPGALTDVLNPLLGVQGDFPEFAGGTWVRSAGDELVIDGLGYVFAPSADSPLDYHPSGSSGYQLDDFGTARPLSVSTGPLGLRFVGEPAEWEEGPQGFPVQLSPPRIRILDTAFPESRLLATVELPTDPSGLHLAQGRLHVLREPGPYLEPGGLDQFDFSDPENPRLAARVDLPGGSTHWVWGDNAVTLVETDINAGDTVHRFRTAPDALTSLLELPLDFSLYYHNGKLRAGERYIGLWHRFAPADLVLVDSTDASARTLDLEQPVVDFDLHQGSLFAMLEEIGLRAVLPAASDTRYPGVEDDLPVGGQVLDRTGSSLWATSPAGLSRVVVLADQGGPTLLPGSFGGAFAVAPLETGAAWLCGMVGTELLVEDAVGWQPQAGPAYTPCFDLTAAEGQVYLARAEIRPTVDGFSVTGSLLTILESDSDRLHLPLGELRLPSSAQHDDIFVSDGRAYLADLRDDRLDIVDVSDPARPQLTQTLPGAGGRNLVVHGGRAYLAAGTEGLRRVDLDAPAGPRLLVGVGTSDARDLAVAGNLLYLADGPGGVKVFDARTLELVAASPAT